MHIPQHLYSKAPSSLAIEPRSVEAEIEGSQDITLPVTPSSVDNEPATSQNVPDYNAILAQILSHEAATTSEGPYLTPKVESRPFTKIPGIVVATKGNDKSNPEFTSLRFPKESPQPSPFAMPNMPASKVVTVWAVLLAIPLVMVFMMVADMRNKRLAFKRERSRRHDNNDRGTRFWRRKNNNSNRPADNNLRSRQQQQSDPEKAADILVSHSQVKVALGTPCPKGKATTPSTTASADFASSATTAASPTSPALLCGTNGHSPYHIGAAADESAVQPFGSTTLSSASTATSATAVSVGNIPHSGEFSSFILGSAGPAPVSGFRSGSTHTATRASWTATLVGETATGSLLATTIAAGAGGVGTGIGIPAGTGGTGSSPSFMGGGSNVRREGNEEK